MRLEHTRICHPARCKKLQAQNIVTAGDLIAADPESLARALGAPLRAVAVIKRYQRTLRFAASVPGMSPRAAQLLISIHRRSVQGLAQERPHELRRDIERFALSSQGRKLLKGRRVPGVKRIRKWIDACDFPPSMQVA